MKLTEDQNDALTEVVNIGVGKAASSLGELIGERIHLSVPIVIACSLSELAKHIAATGEQLDTSVIQDFNGELSGRAVLVFPRASAVRLGQVLAGFDEIGDEEVLSLADILEETGNIVLNGVLGSIGSLLSKGLTYSAPRLCTGMHMEEIVAERMSGEQNEERSILVTRVKFEVARRDINGSLFIVFDAGSIETLLDAILNQWLVQ